MTRNVISCLMFLILTVAAFQASAIDYTVKQLDKAFVMDGKRIGKFEVKLGDIIHFENQDPWFHNIFSLSDTKTFDLGSYPKGESRAVTFDKAGKIEIECAIHPGMFMEVDVK
ncbi:MAG TPA: plastocyanin/azurin family copper-binding protein [Gammaproteobacteria bacterium]